MEQQIMYLFDLLGTVIFAITGAVRGVRLKLDLLGVVVHLLLCTQSSTSSHFVTTVFQTVLQEKFSLD